MRSLGSRYFYFNEDGDYLPNGKPTTPAPVHSHVETSGHARSLLASEILSRPHDGYDPHATHLRGSKTYLESDPLRQDLITHPNISFPPDPVSGGRSVPAGQVTVGLTLVVNGKTFPKIEGGQGRWVYQRPGPGNNYSRYSDLVRHDKAKGLTPMPKASKAELATARRRQTFG